MGGINLSKEPMPRYCEFGVIFTRSASIIQRGESENLINQKKDCEEYAKRRNIKILQYFGGLYAIGINETRSEIIRMQYFLEKNSFIGNILSTTPDRIEGRNKKNKDLCDQLLTLSIDLLYCPPFNKC